MRRVRREYQRGDERVFSAFLWLPKTIGPETRWLERASWVGSYEPEWATPSGKMAPAWFRPVRWLSP